MTHLTSGAAIDTRSEKEKAKDWKFSEVVASAATVNWQEKPSAQWRKFQIYEQNGSGSCVAQTEAKEMGIMRFLKDGIYVHFSATDIYSRRANKPAGGMGAVDARSIVAKGGATLEALTPSQSMTDQQMDTAVVEAYKRSVGEVFKVSNYLELPTKDIETVASVIQQTGKGVMVWFYFKNDEWTERPAVKYQDLSLPADTTTRHSVTAIDFTLVNGKKCLIIEDSWGPNAGMGGQRIIDEDFFKARNWYASYLLNFKFDQLQPIKPQHFFAVDLEFGQTNDEVKALQDCLRYEGTFPSNAQSSGYFGSVTKKAVEGFQTKYGIAQAGGVGFGRVGPRTRERLNILFGS